MLSHAGFRTHLFSTEYFDTLMLLANAACKLLVSLLGRLQRYVLHLIWLKATQPPLVAASPPCFCLSKNRGEMFGLLQFELVETGIWQGFEKGIVSYAVGAWSSVFVRCHLLALTHDSRVSFTPALGDLDGTWYRFLRCSEPCQCATEVHTWSGGMTQPFPPMVSHLTAQAAKAGA